MDSSFDVPDPSDWLGTPVSKLAPVETALRCQVCKDFFTTPVITSCSHTFCSLCIRRCLTNDGKCPTCRAVDQELRLRPNWIVQELVDTFQVARSEVLQLGRDVAAFGHEGKQGHKKRKFELADTDDEETLSGSTTRGRKTRSQGKDFALLDPTHEDKSTADGLIACPICSKRMKEEEVFAHLDVHNEHKGGRVSSTRDTAFDPQTFVETGLRSRTQPKALMERLPQLNYSLLSDNALRKKLSGLGMPTNGPRGLLVRRHTEWVNLVNSNCDSRTPKSKRELLHELDIWERSQGRQILNSGPGGLSVMDKDFDGAGWALKHDNDFQTLIAQAREKAKSQKITEGIAEGQSDAVPKAGPVVENDGGPARRKSLQSVSGSLPSIEANNVTSGYPDKTTMGVFVDLDAGE